MVKPYTRYKDDEVVWEGWRQVTLKHFKRSDGKSVDFYTTNPVGSKISFMVALTDDGKVIITEQFRLGPEKVCQDVPAGFVEDGEDPLHAAHRELLEETGYKAEKMELLGSTMDDAYGNSEYFIYFASGCKKVAEQNLDKDEEIDVKLISIDQLMYNATHGEMTNGLVVLYAQEKLKEWEKTNDKSS